MHALLTRLAERFPDAVLAVREEGPHKDLVAQVKPAAVPEIARFLKDLVQNDHSAEIRENALSALADFENPYLAYFKLIALSAKDEDLVRTAIHGLAGAEGPAAGPKYVAPFQSAESIGVVGGQVESEGGEAEQVPLHRTVPGFVAPQTLAVETQAAPSFATQASESVTV